MRDESNFTPDKGTVANDYRARHPFNTTNTPAKIIVAMATKLMENFYWSRQDFHAIKPGGMLKEILYWRNHSHNLFSQYQSGMRAEVIRATEIRISQLVEYPTALVPPLVDQCANFPAVVKQDHCIDSFDRFKR